MKSNSYFIRATFWWPLVALMLALPCMWAKAAGWTAIGDGETGFNTPVAYANLRTVDLSTVTLAAEQTAGRLTYAESMAGGSSIVYNNGTAMDGMAGNRVRMTSGSANNNPSSLTVNFAGGGTSYVAFLWGLSVKDEDSQYVTFTFSDASTVTLTSCQDTGNSGCVGKYVSGSWLGSLLGGLLDFLFGGNAYDTTYVTYIPATGVTITKVQFFGKRCDGCGAFGSNATQYLYVDNLSYVDATVAPHHIRITTPSANISAGATTTFTVTACANAACSSLYTTGLSGTFALTGASMTPTYPTGQTYTIAPRSSSTTITASITPSGTATVALTAPSKAPTNTPSVFCGIGVAAASGNSCNLNVTQPLHHVRLTTASSNALTCSPVTYTITACSNADCSSLNTAGLTGNLSVGGVTVNYPSGAGFTIGAGNSSTTVSAHMTTVGTGTATLTGLSTAPTNTPTIFCGMGVAAASGNACGVTVASSALMVSVPDHYAEAATTATITAVRASDNNAACIPAFASVSKNVTLKCTYSNPASGTKAVRVGGAALNAGNNAASACDGTGQSVSLSFNASGVATPTLQYADVGAMGLSATYTGSGSDAGLSMTGSDSFIVAPYYFSVAGPGAGNIKAGNSFSATVTARNLSGTATPNFGKESAPAGVTLSFSRSLPTGAGAQNGSFSGTVGAFNAGAATGSNLNWSEVGRGEVVASLTGGSYLASGMNVLGSTAATASPAWVPCAGEGGTCTLAAGVGTAYVAYGAIGSYAIQANVSGSIGCNNGVFGDPIGGVVKSCAYLPATTTTGNVGPFTPHHFDVETTNGCSTANTNAAYTGQVFTPFTYGGFTTAGVATLTGQPFSVTVRARNAAGNTTVNYDGSGNTSPNYAKATTLSVVGGTNIHSMTNATVAAASFASGSATVATPTLLFADTKLRAATAVTIRATDTDSVTSNGYSEGTIALRSGRIKVSNAFGSERNALVVPVQAQYWSGSAWVLNSHDYCTSILAASVARSNYLDHKGAASAAWTTTPSAVNFVGGNGSLTLSAPNPAGSVGSVDFALNLGTTGTDGSCQSLPRPASTAGDKPWLRSQNGSGNNCSDATYTRDPSARATFGVYEPESRRTVFTRELY